MKKDSKMKELPIDWKALDTFLNIRSPSTGESNATEVIAKYMYDLGIHVQKDSFGSVICSIPSKKKDAPTLLLDAHLDEVGFKVIDITKGGFIRCAKR